MSSCSYEELGLCNEEYDKYLYDQHIALLEDFQIHGEQLLLSIDSETLKIDKSLLESKELCRQFISQALEILKSLEKRVNFEMTDYANTQLFLLPKKSDVENKLNRLNGISKTIKLEREKGNYSHELNKQCLKATEPIFRAFECIKIPKLSKISFDPSYQLMNNFQDLIKLYKFGREATLTTNSPCLEIVPPSTFKAENSIKFLVMVEGQLSKESLLRDVKWELRKNNDDITSLVKPFYHDFGIELCFYIDGSLSSYTITVMFLDSHIKKSPFNFIPTDFIQSFSDRRNCNSPLGDNCSINLNLSALDINASSTPRPPKRRREEGYHDRSLSSPIYEMDANSCNLLEKNTLMDNMSSFSEEEERKELLKDNNDIESDCIINQTSISMTANVDENNNNSTTEVIPGVCTAIMSIAHDPMNKPIGILPLPSGEIVVADTFNDRLALFEEQGKFIKIFNSLPPLRCPSALVVSQNDKFAVKGRRKIALFSMNGEFINSTHFKFLEFCYGLITDSNDNIVTMCLETGLVLMTINPSSGQLISRLTVHADIPPNLKQFSKPYFFANQGPDRVVIVDLGLNRIYIVNPTTGKLFYKVGKKGKKLGEYHHPAGVVCDSRGYILIADSLNHRIQVLNPVGKSLTTLNLDRDLKRPSGLAIANNGDLLVANYWEDSVVRYKLFYSTEKN